MKFEKKLRAPFFTEHFRWLGCPCHLHITRRVVIPILNLVEHHNEYSECLFQAHALREKCPYSDFFWSVSSSIRTEHGHFSRGDGLLK